MLVEMLRPNCPHMYSVCIYVYNLYIYIYMSSLAHHVAVVVAMIPTLRLYCTLIQTLQYPLARSVS